MMLDKFKSIVGHLLLNLHRNCGAEFACRILLSKVISKVLELWCRMWIESEFQQYLDDQPYLPKIEKCANICFT